MSDGRIFWLDGSVYRMPLLQPDPRIFSLVKMEDRSVEKVHHGRAFNIRLFTTTGCRETETDIYPERDDNDNARSREVIAGFWNLCYHHLSIYLLEVSLLEFCPYNMLMGSAFFPSKTDRIP